MSFYKKLSLMFCVFGLSVAQGLVYAEDDMDDFEDDLADFYGDEEFVSIATGSKKPIRKAPSVASVITSDQIEKMGARNLSQVLETVPGLHVSRSGQLMAPEFWFRGITSTFNPQTLIMINGVSTKSTIRGDNHVVWGEYPVHSIERIEIIRGPGSALYGADAFSGVINIITKTAEDLKSNSFGASVGSFSTYNLWLNNKIDLDSWQLAMNLEYLKSDGFDAIITADAQTAVDAVAATLNIPAASFAPGELSMQFESFDMWLTAENESLKFDFGTQERRDVGTGPGTGEALDPVGLTAGYKRIVKVTLKDREIAPEFKFNTQLSYYGSSQEVETDVVIFPPGAFFGAFPNGFIGSPGWEEETTKIAFNFAYSGFSKSDLSFGVGYDKQNLYKVTERRNFFPDLSPRPNGVEDVSDTAEVFIPEASRESSYLYFQTETQFSKDWELTAGARYDDYTDFGSTFNPRVALVWSTTHQLTSKFLYGRAFRAPAFAELLVVNNPIALGNSELEPETIDTYELAFNYNYSQDFSLDFNLYNYKIDDFITFAPDPNGVTATAKNVGKRSGIGFETSFNWKVSDDFKLNSNIAYVDAEDDLENDDVGDYPNLQFYVNADWSISDAWNIRSQIITIGDRERTPQDVREKLDGYTQVNLSASYQLEGTGSTIKLIATNLFDEDIFEPSSANVTLGSINIPNDLPQAGRAFYLKFETNYD